ncbi:hypothetical protein E5981_08375 [Bacteroides faecichinchillae]|nr:hypothetical protein E5981_08375 [Bacteroides faecichinchillae]
MFCNVAILINTIYVYYLFLPNVILAHEDTKNANMLLFISQKFHVFRHYSMTFSRTSSILVAVTLIILN